jgi:GNAT superfamily N-acetyltransferase
MSIPQLPKGFLDLDALVYKDYPHTIPEDTAALEAQFGSRNPFFATGSAFADALAGEARLSAFVSPDFRWQGEGDVAWFGHWETVNDAAPNRVLFARMAQWLRDRGVRKVLGPVNFNTFGRYRLLHGATPETKQFQGEPFNPAYYVPLLEELGFKPALHYTSSTMSAADPNMAAYLGLGKEDAEEAPGFEIRALDATLWHDHLPAFHHLVESAFSTSPGYVSITFDIFRATLGKSIGRTLCPKTSRALLHGGVPVGMAICYPDYARLLERAAHARLVASALTFEGAWPLLKDGTLIVKTVGIHPAWQGQGLQKKILLSCLKATHAAGYHEGIAALMRAGNRSRVDIASGARGSNRHYSLFCAAVEDLI